MKKRILIVSLTSLLTACSSVNSVHPFDNQQAAYLLKQHVNTKPAQQQIALNLPNKKDWQRIDVSYGTVGTPIMLIPANETQEDWTESFRTRISDYATHPNITPTQLAQQQINDVKSHCAEVNGKITHETPEYATYQLNMSGCYHENNLVQVGKALRGSDAIYLVSYSATTYITNHHFEKMARSVNSATLAAI